MSDAPPDFTGDLDGYLKWREENPAPFNPLWCGKHWAPCPVEGKNGIIASIQLQKLAMQAMPEDVLSGGPSAMNSWAANQTESFCCKLGDEEMAKIWEEA